MTGYHTRYVILNPPRRRRMSDDLMRELSQAGWLELYLEARAECGLGEPQGVHPSKCPAALRVEPARRHGVHPNSHLTEEDRGRIVVMAANGMSYQAIACALHVSKKTVYRVMVEAREAAS